MRHNISYYYAETHCKVNSTFNLWKSQTNTEDPDSLFDIWKEGFIALIIEIPDEAVNSAQTGTKVPE